MMVGMAVDTTVDSKDASAVTSTRATVTARTWAGAKRAVAGSGRAASRAAASGGAAEARLFVERHGIVLQAARGPVPSLAEHVAGGPIRGSWWGHPKGKDIYR